MSEDKHKKIAYSGVDLEGGWVRAVPPAEAHCATCGCVPGMTPAIRFDTTPAERDGVVRDHLIRMGWTPPAEVQAQGDAFCDGHCTWLDHAPGCPRYEDAPPSVPVGVEWLCRVYADAYHAGHHATVEGNYVDVLPVDRDTYWREKVEEDYPEALAAHQPAAEPTNEAVAEFRRFLNGKQPVDGKITMKQARHILREWPSQQPAAVDGAAVERVAALLHNEATDEPWTVAGVEHDGPDREYYRELARKAVALAAQHGGRSDD